MTASVTPMKKHAGLEIRSAMCQVRQLTGMTHRALRLYEAKGLIRVDRNARGHRLYDQKTVSRLLFIAEARRAGLAIQDIRKLLAVGDREGEARMADAAQNSLMARLETLRDQTAAILQTARRLGLSLNEDASAPRLAAAG